MTSATIASVRQPCQVRFSGRASGRPVLFFAGPEGRQETWWGLSPHLTADHLVIVADQPEAAVPGLGAHGRALALLGLVRRLDLTDVVLVADATTARTAALAAQQDPSRFGLLVLVVPEVDGRYLRGVSVPVLRLDRRDLLDPARIAQELRGGVTP